MSKPLQLSPDIGFVLFGERLSGTANMIAGPIFGMFLAAYAYGIFAMRRFALPMGVAYSIYVLTNLILWNFRKPADADGDLLFGLAYMAVAIGVSAGSAYLLSTRRDALT